VSAPTRPAEGPVSAFPLAVGALAVLAPPAIVAWLAAAVVLRLVPAVRRWHLAAAGCALAGLSVAVGGPTAAMERHFWLGRHLATRWLSAGLLDAPGAVLWPGLARMVPLGVAAGALAAAVNRPAELAPVVADDARRMRRELRQRARALRLAARAATGQPPPGRARALPGRRPPVDAPPLALLGVSLGGDLSTWRHGRYVILPAHAARLPRLVIGRPGAGKSVYLAREAFLAGLAGRRLIVLDGKGEHSFATAIVAAYEAGYAAAGRPGPSVHLFPAEPLNGWAGTPQAQVNRLLGIWSWSIEADYYRENCVLGLRLACAAPGPPVGSMAELVNRLDPTALARLWKGTPEAALVKTLTPQLGGVSMRVANLAAAAGGMLDGQRAIGEADLTVISLPVMAMQSDAESVFRVLMGDLAHWASVRKDGRDATVMVDEFSALDGGRPQAIHLLERARSAGVAVVLSGQSRISLGSDEEADRLIGAAAAVVLFASSEPDELVRLAGTVRGPELVHQLDDGRLTGRASLTMRSSSRVDANRVRSMGPGEAVILAAGRAEFMQVIQAPRVPVAGTGRAPALLHPPARGGGPAALEQPDTSPASDAEGA
jgi:hypothetical protein